MRQNIINGSNGHVIHGYGLVNVVAHRDVRIVDALRAGKPLESKALPDTADMSASTMCAERSELCQRLPATSWPAGRPESAWQAATFEPPAAAWASLVLSRATSA